MKRRIIIAAVYSGLLLARSPLDRAPPKEAARLNPFDGQKRAEMAGQRLFRRECASCHGQEAHGGGRAPGLVSLKSRRAPPGALFWVLRNGSLRRGMPSFAHLPEPQRWQIISYLKTL